MYRRTSYKPEIHALGAQLILLLTWHVPKGVSSSKACSRPMTSVYRRQLDERRCADAAATGQLVGRLGANLGVQESEVSSLYRLLLLSYLEGQPKVDEARQASLLRLREILGIWTCTMSKVRRQGQ